MNLFLKEAFAMKDNIIENRRYIHENAELGFDLPKTRAFVIKQLTSLGYAPILLGEGITCTIGSGQPVILLRADMDALPQTETSGLDFACQTGACHSCGHDAHTAMLLAAAALLRKHADLLKGTVKLMFQAGEETLLGSRKMLDAAGFEDAVIAASNDLDEFLINDLKIQGAAITSWGVGTNLITSKDCPSFGGVYKLAAIQNEAGEFVPKIKISENTEKITNPGNKTIYRIYDKETGKIRADLICFVDEIYDSSEDLLLFDPNATWKKTLLPGGTYTMKEILQPIFINGECKYQSPSVKEIAEFCRLEKDTLWDETKRLFNPHKVYVDLSRKLYDTKTELLNRVNI